MKKIFILLILFLFFAMPCFAEYKPIPKELSKQYRKEVTRIIDKEYLKTINEIKKITSEAHEMYLKVLQNKDLYNTKYITNNFDIIIDSPEFYMYVKIIDLTNKYINIKEDEALATGWSGTLRDFLSPYFKDNDIKTDKLDTVSSLAGECQQKILKEQEELHRFIYSNDNY